MTLLTRLYGGAADLAAPFVARRIAGQLRAQGVAPDRPWERLGHPTLARPPGRLVWLHGASVGEGLSALPLIAALRAEAPGLTCLLTTGTASAARILAERLPEGALHQFAPLDARPVLRRFVDHWRPELLILVESEIWPQMIAVASQHGLPVALVNARLSPGSLRNWSRLPRTAREVFAQLALVSAQTDAGAAAFRRLGAPRTGPGPDLKAAAPPPPGDPQALRAALGERPVWAAVSTHPGEEALARAAHDEVLARHPGALLLLVPRHPERAAEILRSVGRAPRRSLGEAPAPGDPVWLCDTLNETGLWFRLADPVFLGGSLVPVGGHNPWEPAALGRAPLHGPHVSSAAAAYDRLAGAGGALPVTATDLGRTVAALLADPGRRQAAGAAARGIWEAQRQGLGDLARDLLALAEAG